MTLRSGLALAFLLAFGTQTVAIPGDAASQNAATAAKPSESSRVALLQSAGVQARQSRLRSPATFDLARALQSRAIPESAKRQVRARLANAASGIKPATATPPPGQSCADQQLNNVLIVYGGVSCSAVEPSPAIFGSCTWKFTSQNSPLMNAKITPMVAPAGTNSTLTFSTPPNATLTTVLYTVQASCGPGELTYTITVLPDPEVPGNGATGPGSSGGPPPCGACGPTFVAKPIDITDGELWHSKTDLQFSGPFGLTFTRTYASGTIGTCDLGAHWQHNFDARLDLSQAANGSVGFYDEAGLPYYVPAVAAGARSYDPINGLTLALDSTGTTYTVTTFGSIMRTFNAKGELVALHDRVGNTQTITRDTTAGHNDRILNVADPLGRQLCFFSDSLNRVTAVSWLPSGTCPATVPTSGTVVKMNYDTGVSCATGDLCSTTEPDGQTWVYKYLTTDPVFFTDLVEVDDPVGDPEEINTFDGIKVMQQVTGRCSTVPCADTGGDLTFTYPTDLTGNVGIVDGEGRSTAMVYDPTAWMLASISGPLCQCGGDQTRRYAYDSSDRTMTASDDGVDGTTAHTITYTYGRDQGATTYPGPTKAVENLDTVGTTRTTTYGYYPIGDPRQDLPQTTVLPSVDVPGNTMSTADTYSTTGLLTQRATTGFVNGVSTTYAWK